MLKQIDQPRTALRILEQSLKDINAGRWLCGNFIHAFKEKPAGCALGLIGINGGNYPLKQIGSELVCLVTDEATEDDSKSWTDQSHTAMRLLYEAIDEKDKPHIFGDLPIGDIWSDIAEYNDMMQEDEAKEWFSAAITLAKERGL